MIDDPLLTTGPGQDTCIRVNIEKLKYYLWDSMTRAKCRGTPYYFLFRPDGDNPCLHHITSWVNRLESLVSFAISVSGAKNYNFPFTTRGILV